MTKLSHADSKKWDIIRLRGVAKIVDSLGDGVYIINQQYEFEYVNSSFQAGLGPVKGRKCYQYFHGRREPCPWCLNESVWSGKSTRKIYYTKNNGTYDEISTPLQSEDGRVLKLAIFRDITEIQKEKKELKDYRIHLEDLVEKRTTELIAVNKRLEQEIAHRKCIENKLEKLYQKEKELRYELETQMRQEIEFTRALVHELKTPLTALLAASDLLFEGIKEEPYATLVKNIQIGTLALNNRINELIDLVKGKKGILRLKCRPTDVLQLLHEVTNYIIPEVNNKHQSLFLVLPSSLPVINGDHDRLREVLLNLLDNAIKFTPNGGKITLKARQENSTIIIEIQDTGFGISKEKQKRVFIPYYRQEGDEEQFSGLGLGLALCKTLVQLHGGQIRVKSREAKGSTFWFSLPVRKE